MAQLNIGGKSVNVDDSFLKLSPDQQQATVNDIAKQMGIQGTPTPAAPPKQENVQPAPIVPTKDATAATKGMTDTELAQQPTDPNRWRTGDILPIERNVDTGEWRWSWPHFVTGTLDAIKLPGEVMRGEVNPNTQEGFDRTMNLAMMGVSPLKGAGAGAGGAAEVGAGGMGKVLGETVEKVPAKVAEGVKTGTKAEIIVPPKPIENGPKVTDGLKATVVDQELDKFLETQKVKAGAQIGEKKAFPKASVTGTMGTTPVDMTGNITGNIKGPLSVRAVLGDEKGIQLQLKQAERTLTSANTKDVTDFTTQMENAFTLQGSKYSGDVKTALEAAKPAVAQLETPEKVAKFSEDVANVKPGGKASLLDKVFEVWVNGLLSGPQTHAANVLSNLLVNVWSLPEHALTAGISKITRSGSGVTFNEVAHRAIGDLEGVGDALRAAGRSFATERGLFDTNKIEGRMQSIGGITGKTIRIPGKALTAEDAFFKSLAYRQEINGLAVRNAYKEGLTGDALSKRVAELKTNPTEEMMASAQEYAGKQTFTNPLGKMGKGFQNFLNTHKSLRFIVPFYQTPVNLLKYSATRTPLALLSRNVLADIAGKNGPLARDQAVARLSMGTAIGAWVFHEAAKGNVTGAGPTNPNERNLWRKNNQPYSIKIGDEWYSYSRMEPLGTVLGLAADAQTLGSEMSDADVGTVASLLTGALTRNLTSKTWLQGPVNLAEALNDPERYGQQYLQKMLGTIVPAGVAQYARAEDPYIRETQGILDGIKERIPGYKETLNVRRDATGEPIMNEGNFFKNVLSPVYTKAATQDPTISEMLRVGAYPGRLEKQINGVELMPNEWDAYSLITGKLVKQYADAIVRIPEYKDWSDPLRKMALEDGYNKAHDVARSIVKTKFPDLPLRIAQSKVATMRQLAAPAETQTPMQPPIPAPAPAPVPVQ